MEISEILIMFLPSFLIVAVWVFLVIFLLKKIEKARNEFYSSKNDGEKFRLFIAGSLKACGLIVFEDKVVIDRHKWNGAKTIFLKDVSSIQYKDKGVYKFIEFVFTGGFENHAENTVYFGKKDLQLAGEINKFLQNKLSELKTSSNGNVTNVINLSNADELKKFKTLLDEGIITQEEFDKKKKELLGI